MKIPLVGAELFHADKHRQRQDEDKTVFRNFANGPKNRNKIYKPNLTSPTKVGEETASLN